LFETTFRSLPPLSNEKTSRPSPAAIASEQLSSIAAEPPTAAAPKSAFSTFAPADAKGGMEIDPAKTALLCIEFQNEFTTEGGKLYPAVKGVMESTGMLAKAADTAAKLRAAGGKVMHTPIVFKADASDNPNKGLGILAGCAKDSLFTEGTWNADFCAEMKPAEGDIRIVGKRGLDAFPNTSLEKELVDNGIETLVICGFLTNCCVESTMRTACEKGFNVVTLTDCCAATSQEGHDAATTGTFGMFSLPMTAADFAAKLPAPPKPTFNAFAPADAKGGTEIVPAKTALLCIGVRIVLQTMAQRAKVNLM